MNKILDKVIPIVETAFIGAMILFGMYIAAALGFISYSLTH